MGKKNYILSTLAEVLGVQSQKYKKNDAKVPYFNADFGGRLTFWPAMGAKNVKI